MRTDRFIIKTKDFQPIKHVVDNRPYLSASFTTSSCNWNDHVYCDVTYPTRDWNVSVHKWMASTGSICHFITAI